MKELFQIGSDNYSVAGDLAVIAICLTIVILLKTSYVNRTRSLAIFINTVVSIVIAAVFNIVYNALLIKHDPNLFTWTYVFRILYQFMLFDIFSLFLLYLTQISGMDHKEARTVAIVSTSLMFVIIIMDVIATSLGYGFKINDDGTVLPRTNLYMIGYVAYIIMIIAVMYYTKNMLYKRVVYGFYGTIGISLFIRIIQIVLHHSSLTTMTFIFPVIAMLYIMHATPYNIMTGSVDVRALEDMVRSMYAQKKSFIFMSLHMTEYDEEGLDIPIEIQAQIRQFVANYFKKAVLFQISNGHLILVFPKKNNPNYEAITQKILDNFYVQYERFQKEFKIVIGESIDEISSKNEYASFILRIEDNMQQNTVKRVSPEDVLHFNRNEYILRELADIYRKRDLNDPRVLVYCQPVLDLRSNEFNTAEALMRLTLDETGMIYPDEFIPLAEQNGYIHILTEIILNKTCLSIHKFRESGHKIDRISVNVSVLELKDDAFCDDIFRIIEQNGIESEKIAIELTESCNENDALIMKEKIDELRGKGLHIYLDDFGTGYSNMERLMELPFDIIKFDRSLVTASKTSERSERIVDNLAHMFKDTGFSVLFEGVEDEDDARRCSNMFASYLQGYKYSRPIPIDDLEPFLKKTT